MKSLHVKTITLVAFVIANHLAFAQMDFLDPISPPYENQPMGIVSGQFDGEGGRDLAYCDRNAIHFLLNRGNLTFDTLSLRNLGLNQATHPMISTDLNDDGRSELVLFDNSLKKNKVSVISVNNGVPTTVRYDVEESAFASEIVVDDYNTDGIKDIIFGTGSGPVQILQGLPAGGFTLQQLDLGESILAMAITDLNSDGKKDFVVSNYSTQLITFIASGTTYTKTTYTGVNQYGDLIVEDFSGDGIPDVIASPASGNAFHYFANNGTGTLTRSNVASTLGANRTLVKGDYDKDGRPDFMAVGYSNSKILLFKNLGTGNFQEQVINGNESIYSDCIFDDLDDDGTFEIIAFRIKTIQIFKVIGAQYQSVKRIIRGTTPGVGVIADLNADGHVDLVTGSSLPNLVSVYYGDANGKWSARKDVFVGCEVAGLQVADVNADGMGDIIFTSFYANFSLKASTGIILSDAQGTLTGPIDLALGSIEYDLATADLNGDGKMDFVTNINSYIGNGNGTFTSSAHSVLPYTPNRISLGKVNGDNLPDLFITDHTAVHYALNNGAGKFTSWLPLQLQVKPDVIIAADINNDGKADLVVADQYNKKISLALNSDGTAFTFKTFSTDANISVLDVADVNKDGRKDIVAGVLSEGINRKLMIYLQDATGNFEMSRLIDVQNYPFDLIAGDVNNDTYPDIVSIAANDIPVQVLVSDFTTEPASLATNLSVTPAVHTAVLTLTGSDADGRIILIREGAEVDSSPVDGTFYGANSVFKVGNKIGTENYVVARADIESITISGLLEGKTYYVKVFEYNTNNRNTIINYAATAVGISFTTMKVQRIIKVENVTWPQPQSKKVVVKSTSGLPVSLVLNSGNGIIKGDTVLINGPGPIQLKASQAGNASYTMIADTTISFCVNPPKPTIFAEENEDGFVLTSSSESNNQWFLGSTQLPNALGQQYLSKLAGNYYVKVDFGGCFTLSDAYKLVITSVELPIDDHLRIFPNPATQNVRIESPVLIRQVSISDVAGNNVYSKVIDSNYHDVAIGSFPTGVFIVRIKTTEGVVTKRILKK